MLLLQPGKKKQQLGEVGGAVIGDSGCLSLETKLIYCCISWKNLSVVLCDRSMWMSHFSKVDYIAGAILLCGIVFLFCANHLCLVRRVGRPENSSRSAGRRHVFDLIVFDVSTLHRVVDRCRVSCIHRFYVVHKWT